MKKKRLPTKVDYNSAANNAETKFKTYALGKMLLKMENINPIFGKAHFLNIIQMKIVF